jgi:hypothetical protein
VCLSYDEKRRMARLVSPLSGTPIPAADFATAKTIPGNGEGSKPEKGAFAERASSCVIAPVAFGDTVGHPPGDFRLRPRHVFPAEGDLFRKASRLMRS